MKGTCLVLFSTGALGSDADVDALLRSCVRCQDGQRAVRSHLLPFLGVQSGALIVLPVEGRFPIHENSIPVRRQRSPPEKMFAIGSKGQIGILKNSRGEGANQNPGNSHLNFMNVTPSYSAAILFTLENFPEDSAANIDFLSLFIRS
jgi:hypothetical protein